MPETLSETRVSRPRALMVGRTRYRFPLSEGLARKFDALGERLELRVLATGTRGNRADRPEFLLHRPLHSRAFDSVAFYARLPFLIARELRAFRPAVVLAQSPFEAAAAYAGRKLARRRVPVVVELHGDWASFARLYGSRLRRPLAPVLDRIAARSLGHADAVRTLSPFTTKLARRHGVEPAATFTTYTDLSAFADPPALPLPQRPTALFVGVLQRYKNVDGIVAAWRLAAPKVPEARLVLVGDGPMRAEVERLVAEIPAQTAWHASLPTPEVVTALDTAWCLLLPSRSEGTPRVILEALCRGRGVIGGRVGGIPDAVNEENGFLVDPSDVEAIAEALVRLLSDRALAERLGAQALADSQLWRYTAAEYADNVVALVERVSR
ncbi:MAG: glycosyltransferase family 4 protein [Actinobacteria bacterium]|nr:glycosyltransferase family 4 protein [Actinomycetota bacterium]